MKIAGALAFGGFFMLLASAAAAQAQGSKKQEDLKWAKGVATDFLAAMRAGEVEEAATLMTAEYRKSFRVPDRPLPNWVYGVRDAGLAKGHTIKDEQIAPDQDEATFKGLLQGEKREAAFSLRVVREKAGGRWRVAFFRYGPARDIPAPKK
jgi:hypothetical protein